MRDILTPKEFITAPLTSASVICYLPEGASALLEKHVFSRSHQRLNVISLKSGLRNVMRGLLEPKHLS